VGKSYRVTIRFNPEYDQEVIDILECLTDRTKSKMLRFIIRENINSIKSVEVLSDKNINISPSNNIIAKPIVWKIPK